MHRIPLGTGPERRTGPEGRSGPTSRSGSRSPPDPGDQASSGRPRHRGPPGARTAGEGNTGWRHGVTTSQCRREILQARSHQQIGADMRFTVSLKVAQTAPSYANEREHESSPSVYQDEHGNRFYVPDHIGDVVMTSDGYAEVIAVSDHE